MKKKPGRPKQTPKPCSVSGCSGMQISYGYCTGHYQRFKKTGDVQADKPFFNRSGGKCRFVECPTASLARGFCYAHYWTMFYKPLRYARGTVKAKTARTGRVIVLDGKECFEIPVGRGLVTIVDIEDSVWASKFNWGIMGGDTTHHYAMRRVGRKTIYLHREISKCPAHLFVDHINRNGLDNRRHNLRHATTSQNGCNKAVASKFRGVSLYKARNKWQAQIKLNGKNHGLGHYDTPEEAARAYDKAAVVRGEFAILNFGGAQ